MFVPTGKERSKLVMEEGVWLTAQIIALSQLPGCGTASSQLWDTSDGCLEWQAQQRFRAPCRLSALHEYQRSSVRFGDLTTQWQTDPRTVWLCGKKRHERIRRIHNPGPFVLNKDFEYISFSRQPIATLPVVSSEASTAWCTRLINACSTCAASARITVFGLDVTFTLSFGSKSTTCRTSFLRSTPCVCGGESFVKDL
jgi:hypothetical protein